MSGYIVIEFIIQVLTVTAGVYLYHILEDVAEDET